jgi:hypothetical protein
MTVRLFEKFDGEFDLVLASCGYEARATRFLDAERPPGRVMKAVGYGSHEVLAFEENREKLEKGGYEFERVEDEDFPNYLREVVSQIEAAWPRVFVDISCLTRLRLAQVVEILSVRSCDVTFFYSLASFVEPSHQQPANEFLQPASPFFSGWSGDIEKPTAIVAGLGYEYMRAVGVIDHLDPAGTWLFFPRSPIVQYDERVRSANELLLRGVDPAHVLDYSIEDFPELCRDLFALVGSLRSNYRCVIVPLGPKLFALASLLAGAAYRDASVWRASAGGYAVPMNRLPSEHSYNIHVSFRPD